MIIGGLPKTALKLASKREKGGKSGSRNGKT